MRAVRWLSLLIVVLLSVVIATLPLRLLLPTEALPVTILEVQGSIWDGMLRDVRWGALAVGDVGVRLQPWPLIRGERWLRLTSAGGGAELVQGRRSGLAQASGRWLLQQPQGLTMLDLAVDLRALRALFEADRCAQVGGEVVLQVLPTAAGEAAGLLPLQLRGHPRCVDDAVLLRLAPDSELPAGVRVDAELRLWRDGRWQWRTRIEPGSDTSLLLGLQLLGFVPTETRDWMRTDQGQL
ncbi:type II secretion system protein N [Xanthomonas maliensis]|uniref:type II secretion system protein N n=1 Tax=Xanthomonas maliensis TaxID=1321368 RepID=UPI0003A236A9|nr:type II secretion system protein N [Xanthomonas maliensis]KAB7767856.1 type II secretion system protein N [Xanthomonas maliensis]